jgi:hypothetical protein
MDQRAFTISAAVASLLVAACGDGDLDDDTPARPPVASAGAGGTAADAPRGGSSGAGGSVAGSAGAESGSGGMSGSGEALGGAGGAGSSVPAPVFCDAPNKVLMVSCGVGSCHANENATIGDYAHSPESILKYVDVPARRHADCGLIIDSSNYADSFILRKVRGEFEVPYCGERMPVGSFTITEEQIDCLASWLQQFQM